MREAIQLLLDSSLALVAALIIFACLATVLANIISGGTHDDLDAHRPRKHNQSKYPSRPKPKL
jgi:hypothetical protein